jgi:hypothetical protein
VISAPSTPSLHDIDTLKKLIAEAIAIEFRVITFLQEK